MNYCFQLLPHANIRYQESLNLLGTAELSCILKALHIESEVQLRTIGGAPFLYFEAPELTAVQLAECAKHSAVHFLCTEENGLLRPIDTPRGDYLPRDLAEVLKYKGKTSAVFTHMMINLALSVTSGKGDKPLTVLDPLCGRGTTCFVDMTIKSAGEKTGLKSAAAGAAWESGIRAVINRGLAGVSDSEESLMKYGQAVREMEIFGDQDRITFMHGPHAPYSCMADYLKKLTDSCRERGIGQTIHLSESQAEMEGMAKEHGMTPIQYVDSVGVFDVPTLAAHCVYATDEDIRIMAEKGVSIVINPKSNITRAEMAVILHRVLTY